MSRLVPVILCGGSGTRLWPLSVASSPKQFHSLDGSSRTLLQATVERLSVIAPKTPPTLVLNAAHRDVAERQLRAIGQDSATFIVEPEGRNTAPAVALAAMLAGDADTLVVLPADHTIGDTAAWASSLRQAARAADCGFLTTLGVKPIRPETGYGYIQIGEEHPEGFSRVARFVEKPDAALAERYLQDGAYCWNSGMFVFQAAEYLRELRHWRPEVYDQCVAAVEEGAWDGSVFLPEEGAFLACPAESVDYAVLEHTDRAAVVPLDAGWSDIGSWDAVYELVSGDHDDNTTRGTVFAHGSRDNLVLSQHRPVAVVGVDGLIVVETEDAVLIVRRGQSQAVGDVAKRLGNPLEED